MNPGICIWLVYRKARKLKYESMHKKPKDIEKCSWLHILWLSERKYKHREGVCRQHTVCMLLHNQLIIIISWSICFNSIFHKKITKLKQVNKGSYKEKKWSKKTNQKIKKGCVCSRWDLGCLAQSWTSTLEPLLERQHSLRCPINWTFGHRSRPYASNFTFFFISHLRARRFDCWYHFVSGASSLKGGNLRKGGTLTVKISRA